MMNTTKKLVALALLLGASQAYTAQADANATQDAPVTDVAPRAETPGAELPPVPSTPPVVPPVILNAPKDVLPENGASNASASSSDKKETWRAKVAKKFEALQNTSAAQFVSKHATNACSYTTAKTQAAWSFAKAHPYRTAAAAAAAAAAVVAAGVIGYAIKKYCAQHQTDEQECSKSGKRSSCGTKNCTKN